MSMRCLLGRSLLLCGVACALAAFAATACSGGSTGTSGTTGDGGSSGSSGATSGGLGGSCGLSLGWKANGSTCNAWMDTHCCTQEKACAADSTCASFVSCVDACPIPRKDTCLSACGASLPAGVDAIGACSKQTMPAVDAEIPSGCEWP